MKNYYDVLGVNEQSTSAEITKAFKNLAARLFVCWWFATAETPSTQCKSAEFQLIIQEPRGATAPLVYLSAGADTETGAWRRLGL